VSAPSSPARLTALDALRGLIMVIMALDHTRDFIHAGAMAFSPEDLTRTTPLIFLTRWVTHICAPVFMCSAGAGAFLRLQRPGTTPRDLSWFLWTRGLTLIVIELVVMRLAMNFSLLTPYPLLLLVLWALGLSMIVLAALIHLPRPVLLWGSIAVVLVHNAFDGVQAASFGALSGVWNVLHQPGVFFLGGIPVFAAYSLVPWFAVMALGFACGPAFLRPAAARRREFRRWGMIFIAGFLVLRAINVYGDPQPWSSQPSAVFTVLSFLRATKYPPSLEFLLMTLGPALLLLAYLDRRNLPATNPLVIFGRVPLFFYVTHFWVLHIVASLLALVRYGGASFAFLTSPLPSMGGPAELFPQGLGYSLLVTYLVWIGVVVALYPACRWFAGLKQRRKDWWLSYV
jgi:uncharacterized membrane protein